MPKQVQLRRGTTAEHAGFTGAVAEITVDTNLYTIRVHDGVTAGGHRLAKYTDITGNVGGGNVTSVNGQTGVVVLTTANVDEGANLYFTDTRARTAVQNGVLANLTISGNLIVDSNVLYIDSISEKVGIGTTTPQRRLSVYEGTNPTIQIADSVSGIASAGVGSILQYTTSLQSLVIRTYDTTSANGAIILQTGGANDRLKIDNVGNIIIDSGTLSVDAVSDRVGIGTSVPIGPLHLVTGTPTGATSPLATSHFIIDSSASQYIEMRTTAGSSGLMQGLLFTDNGRNAFIGYKEYTGGTASTYGEALHFVVYDYSGSDPNNGFYFGTSTTPQSGISTAHMFIKADGKIGIKTTAPAELFNIAVGAGTANGTVGIRIGGTSNYQSLELGILNGYDGFIRSYGNDLHYYSGHWRTVGTSATEDHAHYWYTSKNGSTNWSTAKLVLDADGALKPGTDNAYNLGTASLRWLNIYTADLNLSNKGSKNDVDGTWGDWTIQEGETELFLLNRRNGKVYKFILQEIN